MSAPTTKANGSELNSAEVNTYNPQPHIFLKSHLFNWTDFGQFYQKAPLSFLEQVQNTEKKLPDSVSLVPGYFRCHIIKTFLYIFNLHLNSLGFS